MAALPLGVEDPFWELRIPGSLAFTSVAGRAASQRTLPSTGAAVRCAIRPYRWQDSESSESDGAV